MIADAELLQRYAETGSEEAFAELVQRCLPLVYGAALRQMYGDEALAKDVAQTVFIALARKAKALVGREVLAGWLYTTTRFAASSALRERQRREAREQIAVAMQEDVAPAGESAAADLKLVLDEAMGELTADDRNAVLLRFFQDKGLREVGTALGLSEDGARMRLNRALGKLHSLLTARGVTLSAGALAAALTAAGSAAVPPGLAASVSTAALAGAVGATGAGFTLFQLFTMTKIKLGIIGAVAAAGVGGALVVQHQGLARLRQENSALRQQAEELDRQKAENERLSRLAAQAGSNQSLAPDQLRELLRLRNEVARLRSQTNELRKAQEETRRQSQAASDTARAAFVSRASWAFSGYETPEAAYQTLWWAIARGDTNTLLASMAPEVRKRFAAQPEALTTIVQRRDYAQIPGFRIISKEETPDALVLTVDLFPDDAGAPAGSKHAFKLVGMKRDEEGWKLLGTEDVK